MTLDQLDAMLSRAGWALARQRGSHRHYANERGQRLTVTQHGKRFEWRQLAAIRADMARMQREEKTA